MEREAIHTKTPYIESLRETVTANVAETAEILSQLYTRIAIAWLRMNDFRAVEYIPVPASSGDVSDLKHEDRVKKPSGVKKERDRSGDEAWQQKKERHSNNSGSAGGLVVGGGGGVRIGPKTASLGANEKMSDERKRLRRRKRNR